jgi:hypothetical protein
MCLPTVRIQSTVLAAALVSGFAAAGAQTVTEWPVHSTARPQPPVVEPAGFVALPRPSDAIPLFSGSSLAEWRSADGANPAPWRVGNDYFEVVPGSGGIATAGGFGDVQLHIEWATPSSVRGEGQDRGNSGVFLMGMYEVQILDSYRSTTYPDGQAGAVYGQFPPLVNASRRPGEWQSYDIIFRAPRFDPAGKVVRRARMTVLHNGILVQDNVELTGPSAHQARPPYAAHPPRLPITLQDHGVPVRFRNVWVRELAP